MQLGPNNVKWQGDEECQLHRTLKEAAGSVRTNSVSRVELFRVTKTCMYPSAELQTLIFS